MEIEGKIIQVLPLQQGTSKAGNPWRKQEFVMETGDNYPKKVKFDFFGDRIDQNPVALGDNIRLSFDLESREFNGRWYTDVRGWKAEKVSAAPATPDAAAMPQAPVQQPAAPQFGGAPAPEPFNPAAADQSDDLPF